MAVCTASRLNTTESKESFNHSFAMFSGDIINRLYKEGTRVSYTDITKTPKAAYFTKEGKMCSSPLLAAYELKFSGGQVARDFAVRYISMK